MLLFEKGGVELKVPSFLLHKEYQSGLFTTKIRFLENSLEKLWRFKQMWSQLFKPLK